MAQAMQKGGGSKAKTATLSWAMMTAASLEDPAMARTRTAKKLRFCLSRSWECILMIHDSPCGLVC